MGLELVPELCSLLIGDVTHHEEAIRSASAEALSTAVSNYRDQSASVLSQLIQLYHQKLYVSTERGSNHIKNMKYDFYYFFLNIETTSCTGCSGQSSI